MNVNETWMETAGSASIPAFIGKRSLTNDFVGRQGAPVARPYDNSERRPTAITGSAGVPARAPARAGDNVETNPGAGIPAGSVGIPNGIRHRARHDDIVETSLYKPGIPNAIGHQDCH